MTDNHPCNRTDLPPRIRDLRWTWHCDYYDGPMAGMVTSDATGPLWATCDDMDLYPRRFRLIRLTVEARVEQERRHDLFRQIVGVHCDYDENGCRAGVFEQPAGWHDFYDMAAAWPRWTPDGEVVGWFVRGEEMGRTVDFADLEDHELAGWVDLAEPGALVEAERRRENVERLRGILLAVWSAALDAMAMQDEATFADLSAEEREQAYLRKQDHHVGRAIEAIREWRDGETECR